MTRASGVTPRSAVSKVAREMPFACACGQSARSKSAKLSARAGTQTSANMSARKKRRIARASILRRSLHQRYEPAAVPLDMSGELQFEQDGAHDRGRGPRQPHEVVDRARRGAEQSDDAAALVVAGVALGRVHWLGLLHRRRVETAAEDRLNDRDHVGSLG